MAISKRQLQRLVKLEREPDINQLKTAAMFRLERTYGRDIHELLDGRHSGVEVASKLGVSTSVVSKWRKRLKIEIQQKQCWYCSLVVAEASRKCVYCGGDLTSKGMLESMTRVRSILNISED